MKNIIILLIAAAVIFLFSCQRSGQKPSGEPMKQSMVREYNSARIFLTAKGTSDRLTDKGLIRFETLSQPTENEALIVLDYGKTFQEIVGFGGAFTDAAAETFYKLPSARQKEFITACFDSTRGIGYTLGRTHINSCDFSSDSYTYTEPGDTALSTFSISRDLRYRVPLIKEALRLFPAMKIFASPWSPPAWMKTNNDMLHGGKLKPEYFGTWAKYFTRFIKEYKKEKVPIWGITVQNEPMAVQTWESCIYTSEDERDFVKKYLGPQLLAADMGDVKLMVWDHNRGIMFQRAKTVLDDPDAAKYVWGTGFHWYVGDHFDNVRMVHDAWPDKHVLFTEGCNYPFDWKGINDWKWGEIYGRSIIHDLNNWSSGWTDWNILLDEKGGPNHVQNYCFAPVIADTHNGSLHYMNSYWYIGHFSKFIRPGAKRIICSPNMDELLATAFLNPDGSIAVIVMNETEKAINTNLWIDGKALKTNIPGRSIITCLMSK